MLKPLVLKNNLEVLRLPLQRSDLFCIGFVAHTGVAFEGEEFPFGVSSLVERLFWCGTDKHPSSKKLNIAIESIGGKLTSFTSYESIQFYLTVPKHNQFKAVSLLSEIIQHSFFDERDLDRERKKLIQIIQQGEEERIETYHELTLSNIYKSHPLSNSIYGTVDSLMDTNAEDVFSYLARQFRPEHSHLVISGNFETKQISDLVEQEWGFWNPRYKEYVPAQSFEPTLLDETPSVEYTQRGIPETFLSVAFLLEEGYLPTEIKELKNAENEESFSKVDSRKILDKMLERWAQILLLNTIIGLGYSSKLWLKGVEEELFFSTIRSDVIRFKETGFFQISGRTDNTQFTFALECVFSVLESLKKTTISINELAKAKEQLLGYLKMNNEGILDFTMQNVEYLVGSEMIFEFEDLIEKINQVNAPQLRHAAADLFHTEKLYISTYGTAKETKIVDKLIKKYLAS